MSTIAVTTVTTGNGTTDATVTTGNTSAGKFVVPSGGGLVLSSNSSTNAVSISTNGNIGVSNTAPGQKLVVGGTIESTTGGFKFPDGTTQTSYSMLSNVQIFNASGTWTKPSGYSVNSRVLIQAWGGGGGGGKYNAGSGGAGGGGGAYVSKWVILSALGATETVTIGAGGTATTTATTSGGVGGTSSLGSILSAYGGGAGETTAGGGGGGPLAAPVLVNVTGVAGRPPGLPWIGVFYDDGCAAQRSFQGAGATSITLDEVSATDHGGGGGYGCAGAKSLNGGGGGGGSGSAGGTSVSGGNGGAGVALTSGIAGTQPGGGGGGTASGTSSGAGGAGRIIVTVFPV